MAERAVKTVGFAQSAFTTPVRSSNAGSGSGSYFDRSSGILEFEPELGDDLTPEAANSTPRTPVTPSVIRPNQPTTNRLDNSYRHGKPIGAPRFDSFNSTSSLFSNEPNLQTAQQQDETYSEFIATLRTVRDSLSNSPPTQSFGFQSPGQDEHAGVANFWTAVTKSTAAFQQRHAINLTGKQDPKLGTEVKTHAGKVATLSPTATRSPSLATILPYDTIQRLQDEPERCIYTNTSGGKERCLKKHQSWRDTSITHLISTLTTAEQEWNFSTFRAHIKETINLATCNSGQHCRIATNRFQELCDLVDKDESVILQPKMPRFTEKDISAVHGWIAALTSLPHKRQCAGSGDAQMIPPTGPISFGAVAVTRSSQPRSASVKLPTKSAIVYSTRAPAVQHEHTRLPGFVETAIGQGFVKYIPPQRLQGMQVEEMIHTELRRRLTKLDELVGHVYVYWVPGNFGYVKIGWTSRTIAERLGEWKSQCGHDAECHRLESNTSSDSFASSPIPHARRVEHLVHTELFQYRRIEPKCQKCKREHNEWFRVSVELAEKVVAKWSKWMVEQQPYEERLSLLTEETEATPLALKSSITNNAIEAMCKITELDAAKPLLTKTGSAPRKLLKTPTRRSVASTQNVSFSTHPKMKTETDDRTATAVTQPAIDPRTSTRRGSNHVPVFPKDNSGVGRNDESAWNEVDTGDEIENNKENKGNKIEDSAKTENKDQDESIPDIKFDSEDDTGMKEQKTIIEAEIDTAETAYTKINHDSAAHTIVLQENKPATSEGRCVTLATEEQDMMEAGHKERGSNNETMSDGENVADEDKCEGDSHYTKGSTLDSDTEDARKEDSLQKYRPTLPFSFPENASTTSIEDALSTTFDMSGPGSIHHSRERRPITPESRSTGSLHSRPRAPSRSPPRIPIIERQNYSPPNRQPVHERCIPPIPSTPMHGTSNHSEDGTMPEVVDTATPEQPKLRRSQRIKNKMAMLLERGAQKLRGEGREN